MLQDNQKSLIMHISLFFIMKVILLGTGSSMVDKDRAQISILIQSNDYYYLFDVGSGALRRLMEIGIDFKQIRGIFFSHFHVDHSSDFATLVQTMWLEGFNNTLNIYGPENITEWYNGLFDIVYPYLKDKIKINVKTLSVNDTVIIDQLTVKTIRNKHGDFPSLAYLIIENNKKVLYSGDTTPTPEIKNASKGVDLLIHELAFPDSLMEKSTLHTVTSQLAEILQYAKPKRVAIIHMYPAWFNEKEKELDKLRAVYDGILIVGTDKREIML